jgi:hypothetical protein
MHISLFVLYLISVIYIACYHFYYVNEREQNYVQHNIIKMYNKKNKIQHNKTMSNII